MFFCSGNQENIYNLYLTLNQDKACFFISHDMFVSFQHTLPDFFEPWNRLAANLLILIQEKNVRTQVHQVFT